MGNRFNNNSCTLVLPSGYWEELDLVLEAVERLGLQNLSFKDYEQRDLNLDEHDLQRVQRSIERVRKTIAQRESVYIESGYFKFKGE